MGQREVRDAAASGRPSGRQAGFGGFAAGVRDAFVVGLAVGAYGTVLGAIAASKGIGPAELALMSMTVLAGSSQFVAVELWATPVPVAEIVAAVMIVNLRYMLICASLHPLFLGMPVWRKAACVHFVTDENWALTMAAIRQGGGGVAHLVGGGAVIFVFWVGGGLAGLVFGDVLPPPEAIGLDFAVTAVFLCLLRGFWGGARADLLPWAVAAGSAIAASLLLPGKWYILAGALSGTAVAALGAGAQGRAGGESRDAA
jgi:4-azaleucine resistance transporter AzlC